MCRLLLIFLTGFLVLSNVRAQDSGDNVSKAKTFLDLLVKKDFAAAESYFGDEMKARLTAEKLAEGWNSLSAQVGNFKRRTDVKTEKIKDLERVVVTAEFEKANLDVQISFDASGKMANLSIVPTPARSNPNAETYKSPEYVKQNSFQEKEATVGAGGEWALPATLTMPAGKGKFPAVVLVHGSGANDRDETHLNPANKPFKDLALGLASNGIAVLRYEKRTKQHGAKLTAKDFTVKEETVDDALAAVALLRDTPGIDPDKIYVLGHSLGGYLIPRIAARDRKIAGFVSLAGATRPLEDFYVEQITYFAKLDGAISKDEQTKIDALRETAAKIKALKPSDRNSPQVFLGIPVFYWLDLQNYNPPAEAKSLKQPILILQGERDYQVTMTDFQNWKTALGSKKTATFKTYPKLNHLFMPGEGTPSPSDYAKTNHISPDVIGDIAQWILTAKK